jgi:hypothetical protein
METVWKTSGGAAYTFTVFTENTTWNDVGGIYIFAGVTPQNVWSPKYIGQTNSFKARFCNHDQLAPAGRIGATHIHAMVVKDEATRLLVEEALIRSYNPPLNTHHVTDGLLAMGLRRPV